MKNIAIRVGVNAVALWAAAKLVGGVHLSSEVSSILFVAVIFGLVNAFIRPVAKFLSFPAIIVTLGLFALLVNAAMLGLTAAVTDSLDIDGFWPAVLGAIVISIVSALLSIFFDDDDDD
ncbi:MAG: phage holin family protein [Acidimicrobiales bacterium]